MEANDSNLTEYQVGYRAAINGQPFNSGRSAEWIRGYHDGTLDLSKAGIAKSELSTPNGMNP